MIRCEIRMSAFGQVADVYRSQIANVGSIPITRSIPLAIRRFSHCRAARACSRRRLIAGCRCRLMQVAGLGTSASLLRPERSPSCARSAGTHQCGCGWQTNRGAARPRRPSCLAPSRIRPARGKPAQSPDANGRCAGRGGDRREGAGTRRVRGAFPPGVPACLPGRACHPVPGTGCWQWISAACK